MKSESSLTELLKECWAGNKPLYIAFWWVALGGNALLHLLVIAAVLIISDSGVAAAVALVVLFMDAVWNIFSLVCIWRCAKNAEKKIWTDMARFYVILVALAIPTTVLLR